MKENTNKTSFFSGLTGQILTAMILGAVLGIVIHTNCTDEIAQSFSAKIKMLATVFIRLVQMIISPLVFTTLVVGIAKSIGFVFYRFFYFVIARNVFCECFRTRSRFEFV